MGLFWNCPILLRLLGRRGSIGMGRNDMATCGIGQGPVKVFKRRHRDMWKVVLKAAGRVHFGARRGRMRV